MPAFVTHLALRALGSPLWRRITGLNESIDLPDLDWINDGADRRAPTLVLHSSGDQSVPIAPSTAFADTHQEMGELVELPPSPHTLEWNRSPELWETTFSEWFHRLPLPGDEVQPHPRAQRRMPGRLDVG